MRARVGDSANRTMSFGRRGAATAAFALGAGHRRPQVADRRADARADVDDEPAATGPGSNQRVDGVVDVEEVAGLTAVAVDQRADIAAEGVSEGADDSAVRALPRAVDGAHRQGSELDRRARRGTGRAGRRRPSRRSRADPTGFQAWPSLTGRSRNGTSPYSAARRQRSHHLRRRRARRRLERRRSCPAWRGQPVSPVPGRVASMPGDTPRREAAWPPARGTRPPAHRACGS